MKQAQRVQVAILALLLGGVVLFVGTALAAGEVLTRAAITIAGGQAVVNGIEVRSAIGQPMAGIVSNNGEMCVGLMCPGSGSTQGVPPTTPTPTGSATPSASTTPSGTVTPTGSVTPSSTLTPISTPGTGTSNQIYLPLITQ
ncbi:MAG: hypothetical protein KF832_05495 [Caldilineaceae bacterium]|nr:hypothetical protein [Caldilineaceae bacterium]